MGSDCSFGATNPFGGILDSYKSEVHKRFSLHCANYSTWMPFCFASHHTCLLLGKMDLETRFIPPESQTVTHVLCGSVPPISASVSRSVPMRLIYHISVSIYRFINLTIYRT